MPSVRGLPSNPNEWKQRVRMKKIKNANIHKVKLRSASIIQEEQFLALRVLRNHNPHRNIDLKRFDLEPWVRKAQKCLDEYESWQIYIDGSVDAREMTESTFVMAKYWQAMAAETSSNQFNPSAAFSPKLHNTRSKTGKLPPKKNPETPTRSTGTIPDLSSDPPEQEEDDDSPGPQELLDQIYTPTKDEEIVTSALFSLLCGLIVHTTIPNRWTVHRKPFKAQFDHASFEARVDGYLADKSLAEKVRALIEVKAMLRKKNILDICMQEAAQMVAWILSDPDEHGSLNLPGRRFHISQDRNEIYITFAEYDEKYIKYLNDKSSSDSDLHFLTMHQYGPWRTNQPGHIRDLGRFLLAICLRAQFDMQKEGVEVQESKGKSETDVDDSMSEGSDEDEDVDMDEDEDVDMDEDDEDDDEYVDDEDDYTSDES